MLCGEFRVRPQVVVLCGEFQVSPEVVGDRFGAWRLESRNLVLRRAFFRNGVVASFKDVYIYKFVIYVYTSLKDATTVQHSSCNGAQSRGLGWRIHGSVEDTKLSTNKQHTLSQN